MSHLRSPYEWVAPLVTLTALAIVPLGPLLFPRVYLIVLILYFAVFLYAQANHVIKFYTTSRKIRHTINRWSQHQRDADITLEKPTANGRAASPATRERITSADEVEEMMYTSDLHYYQTFVIPNYCEPESLLKATINRIAAHSHAASHYIIVLAMEESEEDWKSKGDRIRSVFEDRFLHFIVTGHPPDIPGESRGKGSNVAFGARHACAELVNRGLDPKRIMLTIMDADSAIPEEYVLEMEDSLNRADDPYELLFAPPIFFSRNCFDVPAAVRVTDITWSAMVMSNLSNSRGLSFPCSNYSLSMMLAERVGYWDTDADSVGEDMHMWLKCFFKTNGQVRTVPIFVPINLTNVQTKGYLSNVNARYVQAKRHYNGVADVAYTFRNAFKSPNKILDGGLVSQSSVFTNWRDKLTVCLLILEAHMIPATSGWLMFAAVPLMQFLLFPPLPSLAFISPSQNPILTSEFFGRLWSMINVITLLLPVPLFITLAIYEHLHRAIDSSFLGKAKTDSRRWKHLLDYTMLPVSAWLFMTLPSTLASMKRLLKRRDQYIVSEKMLDDDLSELKLVQTAA